MKLMLMTQRHYTPVAQIARYWQIVGAPSARAVPTLTRVQTRLARGLTVPAAFSTPPIGIGVVLLVALALLCVLANLTAVRGGQRSPGRIRCRLNQTGALPSATVLDARRGEVDGDELGRGADPGLRQHRSAHGVAAKVGVAALGQLSRELGDGRAQTCDLARHVRGH
jgi:hypothetical protein